MDEGTPIPAVEVEEAEESPLVRRVISIDGAVSLLEATADQHRQRLERLEQTFHALLEDVANNPTHAVERAKAELTGITPFVPAE